MDKDSLGHWYAIKGDKTKQYKVKTEVHAEAYIASAREIEEWQRLHFLVFTETFQEYIRRYETA